MNNSIEISRLEQIIIKFERERNELLEVLKATHDFLWSLSPSKKQNDLIIELDQIIEKVKE